VGRLPAVLMLQAVGNELGEKQEAATLYRAILIALEAPIDVRRARARCRARHPLCSPCPPFARAPPHPSPSTNSLPLQTNPL